MADLTTTDFYLIRTPQFSLSKLSDLNRHIQNGDIHSTKEMFKDDRFISSIYFSSRYFYSIALQWINNDEIGFDSMDRILISLYKYYCRICSRSTPYGLFAGYSVGEIVEDNSDFEFAKPRTTPFVRPDMLFIKQVKDKILKDNEDRDILYFPNNTLYRIGESLRYVNWDDQYNYEISEIEMNDLLDRILSSAKKGSTLSEISKLIEEQMPQADGTEIRDFIRSLLENNLIIDRLPPYLTSIEEPINEMNTYFEKVGIFDENLKNIAQVINLGNSEIDINKIESLAADYKIPEDDNTQLFQVDLKINFSKNKINKKILKTLIDRTSELSKLTGNYSDNRLLSFCESFTQRFGEREVPLSTALDPMLGIGYGLQTSGNVEDTPLVNDILFSYKHTNKKGVVVPPIIQLIIEKYIDHFSPHHFKPICISEKDLDQVTNVQEELIFHDDYCLFGELVSDSIEDLDNGNFKFVSKSPLPTAGMSNQLSRFAYYDQTLRNHMDRLIIKEGEDYIYAEIIHSPNDRTRNVLLRPNFYNYEIPYVSNSQTDLAQINVNDIMVTVRDNHIILRSELLNKEIRPRLSSSYNYGSSQLSVIRFLGDLQYHNKYKGFSWDWSVLDHRSYLPRIEYKEIILSEARWKLSQNVVSSRQELRGLLGTLAIPQYCIYKDYDNTLLLDIGNEVCLNIILSLIKKRDIFLFECFHHSSFIQNKKEKFTSEVIFPLVPTLRKSSAKDNIIDKMLDGKSIINDFFPGDEWTYFKFYCSHSTGDKVIREVIIPFIKQTKQKETQWFYLRYEDPEHHIRFRVKEHLTKKLIHSIKLLIAPLIETGYVFSYSIDTYQREVERYGSKNILLSERLFYYDSDAIAEYIELTKDGDEGTRWKAGIISIDMLMDNFEVDLKDRIDIFEKLYNIFLPEYVDLSQNGARKAFKISIEKELRMHKNFLDDSIRLKKYGTFDDFIVPFKNRTKRINSLTSLIRGNTSGNEEFIKLLQSYIHMSLNRLFFTKTRMHELVMYYFMYNTYKSIFYRNETKQRV